MEILREKIISIVEETFENVVSNDEEYKKLENDKNELINKFKAKLADEDYQELEKLVDCFEGQNFITAMGFCFVRVLDLDKLFIGRI